MIRYGVIVIGGGAAGLMAAGQAAELGAKTLLLEKMNRPGRKLLQQFPGVFFIHFPDFGRLLGVKRSYGQQ